jgi:hypothetical protein
MHTVTTVILRLLRNDHISSLRGTLQTLDEPEPLAFKDERELLMLLNRLASRPPPVDEHRPIRDK